MRNVVAPSGTFTKVCFKVPFAKESCIIQKPLKLFASQIDWLQVDWSIMFLLEGISEHANTEVKVEFCFNVLSFIWFISAN